MSRILGDRLIMYINNNLLACAKGFTLENGAETIDVNSESSGQWADSDPGRKNWRVTANYLYSVSDENFAEIYSLYSSNQTFPIRIQKDDDDGAYWEGTGYFSSMSLTGDFGQAAGFNVAIEGKGELTLDFFFNLWIDENEDFLLDENDDFILI